MSVRVSADRANLEGLVPVSSMPVFAHERLVPVHDVLRPLFTGSPVSRAGLVRGQTVVCEGSAAVSCALGVAAGVTASGSWAAIVGMPSIGLLAAATMGVALERTVLVNWDDAHRVSDGSRSSVGSALSALVDGMDLVMISRRCASSLPSSSLRRLQSRAQSKGSVLVIVTESTLGNASISADVRLTARPIRWEGMGEGHGHLRRRLVSIEMDGRRCPQSRRLTIWLPDPTGTLAEFNNVTRIDGSIVDGSSIDQSIAP